MSKPIMFTSEKVATVMTVTPEIAVNWLKFNNRNRNLPESASRKYESKLKRGLWQFNGASIVWNTSGGLNDGQTRLQACVNTGIPIEVVVVWGVDPDAIITLDRGRGRSLTHNLQIIDGSKSKDLARVLNLCVAWFRGGSRETVFQGNSRYEFEDAVDFLKENPDIENFLIYENDKVARKIGITSILAFTHYVCAQIDADEADYFFSRLISGVQSENPNDATIFQLREMLMEKRDDKAFRHIEQAAFTFIAWNLFRSGETRKILRWSRKGANAQKFPEPI